MVKTVKLLVSMLIRYGKKTQHTTHTRDALCWISLSMVQIVKIPQNNLVCTQFYSPPPHAPYLWSLAARLIPLSRIAFLQMYGCRNGAKFNILKFYSYSTFIHSYSTFVSIQHYYLFKLQHLFLYSTVLFVHKIIIHSETIYPFNNFLFI